MTSRQQPNNNNQITLYYIKQIKTEIAKLMLGHEIKKYYVDIFYWLSNLLYICAFKKKHAHIYPQNYGIKKNARNFWKLENTVSNKV